MAAKSISSFKYQMRDSLKSIIIFYIVIVCVYLLLSIFMVTAFSLDERTLANEAAMSETGTAVGVIGGADGPTQVYVTTNQRESSTGVVGGISSATPIFLFVLGLCTFKENFQMLLQNGVSRKSVFWGHGLAAVCIALGTTIIDFILGALAQLLFRAGLGAAAVGWEMITASSSNAAGLGMFAAIVQSFCTYLFCICLGYFITILYYRLSRTGKIIISVGVPVFLMVAPGVAAFQMTKNQVLFSWFTNLVRDYHNFIAAHPAFVMLEYFLGAAFFSLFAWLLMRKAILRK